MSYTDEPQRITAATRAMCRELYGDGFDLHDAGAQDPDFRAGLERAAEAAIDAALDAPGEMPGMRPMTRGESDLMTQVLDLRRKLGAVRRLADSWRVSDDVYLYLDGQDLGYADAAVQLDAILDGTTP